MVHELVLLRQDYGFSTGLRPTRRAGAKVELLDGDIFRQRLTKGLGFSKEDRDENIRRIGFVCHLLTRNGVIAIGAAISPYRAVRDEVRKMIGSFVENLCELPARSVPAAGCEGHVQATGQLANFTGVSDPYEEPRHPELVLYTNEETPAKSARKVVELVVSRGYLAQEILAETATPAASEANAFGRSMLPVGRAE